MTSIYFHAIKLVMDSHGDAVKWVDVVRHKKAVEELEYACLAAGTSDGVVGAIDGKPVFTCQPGLHTVFMEEMRAKHGVWFPCQRGAACSPGCMPTTEGEGEGARESARGRERERERERERQREREREREGGVLPSCVPL